MKRILITALLMAFVFAGYVIIVNIHSKNMTVRQKILKALYPAFMRLSNKKAKTLTGSKQPITSFYSLKSVLNNGSAYDFSQLKDKKILLVNTASNCGYTNQYDELQKLSEQFPDKLIILGFPANDFKEQEKGSDEEIAQFCKVNFGVTFPLMKKSVVVKSNEQNDVFKWLTDSTKNGWNNQSPVWNFSKYLVNENGVLTNYFDPSVSPLSEEIITELKK